MTSFNPTHDTHRRKKALQGALERLEKRIDPLGEFTRQESTDEATIKEAFALGLLDKEDALGLLEKSRNYKQTKQKQFKERLERKKPKFTIEQNRLKRQQIDSFDMGKICGVFIGFFILYLMFS